MKRWIGFVLSLCMVLSLFPWAVSGATWAIPYNDTALTTDFSGDIAKFQNIDTNNWGYSNKTWGDSGVLVYDKADLAGDMTFASMVNNSGSTAGKTTSLYFCYQSGNNYYAVVFGNDATTGIRLIKKVAGVETIIATCTEPFVKMAQHTVTITRTAAGNITVVAVNKNKTVTTTLFSGVVDTALDHGKVAMGFNGDGCQFASGKITGTAYVAPTDPGEPGDTNMSALLERSFSPVFSDSVGIPEGWTYHGFTVASGWSALTQAATAWDKDGLAIYDPFVWEKEITLSAQISNYSTTTTTSLYWMYKDENNYYALRFTTASGDCNARLVKKAAGVETVLATTAFTLADHVITVGYVDGVMNATAKTKSGTTVTLVTNVADTTLTKGKFGVGFQKGGCHFGNLSARGLARTPIVAAVDTPLRIYHRTDNRVAVFANWDNAEKATVTPIVALYAKDGAALRLAGVSVGDSTTNESILLSKEFPIEAGTEYCAKALLWGGLTGQSPILEASKVDYDRTKYKVLAIGNSFSEDAAAHLHNIAATDGVDLKIGNLYIGGCSLDTHWANASSNSPAYRYDENGSAGVEQNVSIRQKLEADDWDMVTIQQASSDSGVWSKYSKVDELAQYIKQYAPQAEVIIHQTWAYEKGSNHASFVTYQNDQLVMYNAIVSAYTQAVAAVQTATGEQTTYIPSGDAMQIARNSEIGGVKVFDTTYTTGTSNDTNTLNRDGYHCSQSYGRYLLGLVWYERLTGNSVAGNTYKPSASKPTAEQITLLKNAAHQAVQGVVAQ